MWSIPGAHDTAINNLANNILLGLLQNLEAQHATIHQQHVIHADVIDEAIIVDRNSAVLAICALLDGEGVLGACAQAELGEKENKRNDKTTSFTVNLMRNQVLQWAAQG